MNPLTWYNINFKFILIRSQEHQYRFNFVRVLYLLIEKHRISCEKLPQILIVYNSIKAFKKTNVFYILYLY